MRWDIIEPLGCLLLFFVSLALLISSIILINQCNALSARVAANLDEIQALLDQDKAQS